MISSETRLHSGEGTVGFKMVGDLFIILAFKDFKKAWQEGYRSITDVGRGRGSQVETMASH